jgi:glycosyltransferase involved in cell wall biosynthesis
MLNRYNVFFSVLVANYNNGDFILDAIQSVLNQTFQDWELVIVDDGSADDSVSIVSELARLDSRIRLMVNEVNRGCGYTKRRCADEAMGEILAYLDPDDVITPDALAKHYELHRLKPSCSIIYSNHYLCNERLEIVKIADYVGQIPPGETHAALPYSGPQISAFASFKKRLYDLTEGINPILKRAVDQDLYHKLEEVGACYYIDEPLYYYRHNQNSISLGSNNLKGRYWNYVVAYDTYKRRKKNKQVFTRQLTLNELNKRRLGYFTTKAYQKAMSQEWHKMYYCLARALPALYLDQKLMIVRIALTPLKNLFRSTVAGSSGRA